MLASILMGVIVAFGIGEPAVEARPPTNAPAVEFTHDVADTAQVLLSLAEQLEHPRARATIIRPAGEDLPDMIVVIDETTPEDLNRAVQMLMAARHSFGPSVDREMRAHVPSVEAASASPQGIANATHHLFELQSGEELDVPGYGATKSILISIVEPDEPAVEQ